MSLNKEENIRNMPWELGINKSLIFDTFQFEFLNLRPCVPSQAPEDH